MAKSNVLALWLMACKWIYLAHFWFRSCKTTRAVGPKATGDTGDTHRLDYFCSTPFRCQGAQKSVLVPDSLVTPVFAAGYGHKWGYGQGAVVNEYCGLYNDAC